MGQVRLGLMHEILGSSPIAPLAFGNAAPDSGNSELLALAGTDEQKDRWLHPLLAGDLRSAFSMTEPHTPGSDPTQLATRAVRDGDDWVIEGRKWFSSNASIADFLIVMAVTNPEARPSQRASMFIVPTDTPGVEILRDVPTMEHPWEQFGAYGGHAEIAYESARVPAEALLGGEGEGFILAQHRLVPGRIHHCMRWLGVARRAFDMMCERATYRHAHGSRAGRQADRAELGRRQRRRDAGGAADDAARRLDDGHAGRARRAHRGRADQVLRREGAARRRRPRAAAARLARLLDRPAARADVPLRARRAHLRRPRRGAPPVGRAADPRRL